MNQLKIAILLSLLVSLLGCGRQVVQFHLDNDVLDAGRIDDAGPKLPTEAGPDASIRSDASAPDASTPDATAPDASAPDATAPDASAPDATAPDASTPVAPVVRSTVPAPAATGVPLNDAVLATFSKPMDPATITSQTFLLQQGITAVPGTVSLNSATNAAMFLPTSMLSANQLYTATITTGAKATDGVGLAASYTWSFTTGAAPAPPRVVLTAPADGATGRVTSTRPTATFSEAMDAATINATTFTLRQGATAVPGLVTYDVATVTATFTPDSALAPGLVYTATVSVGAKNSAGVALAADYVWTFTTAPSPASVLSTTPLPNAVGVSVTARPTATFSQPMDPLTITASTFTLKQGIDAVAGTVSYDVLTNTATFTPTAPLGLSLPYTATITTGARGASGGALASDYVWNFTTAACSQSPVVLGGAANFAVLGGSTVTSTSTVLSPTVINGDLGVSPGTAVTGFPPGMVIGMIHAGTTTSATAIADLTTAYNSAAGRVLCPVTVAGNLGGMTLAPGLYKSTSSLAISSGDLTLDAQGDGDAIFIFQMASTLTTTDDGRKVILTNGAKSANIFWQVGTSATIGVGSVFHGTIMADQAITLKTGASLTGRALARIAAVSLDTNSVVKPAP